MKPGSEFSAAARDLEDVKRITEILRKRGLNPKIGKAERVTSKAPGLNFNLSFGSREGFRSAGKSAVTGACVLYGNEMARSMLNPEVNQAIHDGDPDISRFVGWNYVDEWPRPATATPHSKTPYAQRSGFEHSLISGDVGDTWVAYVEFFGGIRFSVNLGRRSGLPPKGLALNPRALKPERFEIIPEMPQSYHKRHPESLREEQGSSLKGLGASMCNILSQWQKDSHRQYYEELTAELVAQLASVGDDATVRQTVLDRWTEKVASVEFGGSWREDLSVTDLDNGPLE